ncbi:hypothetical protein [Marinifilum fragile]|uniref:hypothetical protein n=1 Tax=Marinifilum fragile TaxID=570161 RepID=UPI002AA8BC90|nr:hypothetical protein [Marinifilum fragile]
MINIENHNLIELTEENSKKINGGIFLTVLGAAALALYGHGVMALGKHIVKNNIDVSEANYWSHGR